MKKYLIALIWCCVILTIAQSFTLSTVENETHGTMLVNEDGMTVYTFALDVAGSGESACTEACLDVWPPVIVAAADALNVPAELAEHVATITRQDDGRLQVTWDDMPLYTFTGDPQAGQANGHNVGNVWSVVTADAAQLSAETPAEPTAEATPDLAMTDEAEEQTYLQGITHPELGTILADFEGYTVYTYANDEPGVTNCIGRCLNLVPPVLVFDEMPLPELAGGDFSVVERPDDGTQQLALDGMPLYYYAEDTEPGMAVGEGVGEVWYVIHLDTVTLMSDGSGTTYYTTPDGMTLYKYANDEPGWSNCLNACAETWIPYTIDGEDVTLYSPVADDDIYPSLRADDTYQVVVNDSPLYMYSGDVESGDLNGAGVDDRWSVATVDVVMAADVVEVATEEPTPPPTCTVSPRYNLVNMRQRPTTNSQVMGKLQSGATETAVGQASGPEGYIWWQLYNGTYVREDTVDEDENCANLPIVGDVSSGQTNTQPVNTPPPPAATEEVTG